MTDFLWSSIYLPINDENQVLRSLKAVYEFAGYKLYNPFPGGTGTPSGIQDRVRLFVAPAESGWIRIIGEADSNHLPALATELKTALLYAWIGTSESSIEVFGSGELKQFLREGKSEADLNPPQIASGKQGTSDQPGILSDLAGEYGVDSKKADKLFQKTTKSILRKFQNEDAQAAMASMQSAFSWSSPPAQRLGQMMDALIIPANWREPDFRDLSTAYQIACLLDIDENAPLLPGDEAILDKVEYPLDYELAYFAK